jgi:hypothetical protein
MTERDRQNRNDRRDGRYRKDRSGQAEKERHNGTDGMGQAEQERRNGTGRTGKTEQTRRAGFLVVPF